MTGVWPWIAAVVVVGLGILAFRTQQKRTAMHEAAVQFVLDGDREEALLEAWLRLPEYQHEERP